jgi:LUC7 N_terminus
MGASSTSYSGSSRRSGSGSNFLTKFTDPRVCRPFLVGHCPHDLFSSTKFELGPCRNQHNERLRAEYLETPDREKYGYEWDYARVLGDYVNECDKRIQDSQTKLETTYEEIFRQKQLVYPPVSSTPYVLSMLTCLLQLKEIGDLSNKITFSLDEISVLGNSGNVAMALQQFYQVDLLHSDKKEKEVKLP